MEIFKNFDWDVTERELVLFIPHFNRSNYIRKWLETFKTEIPTDKWIILIGNDGEHESFDDLKNRNVRYFTLPRKNATERNSSFIRNVAIKNCRSKLFYQKDPDVIVLGSDFIKGCLENNINNAIYRCGETAHRAVESETKDFLNGAITLEQVIKTANRHPITESFVYCQYSMCVPRKILFDLGGYCEELKGNWYDDTDMHRRLISFGLKQILDKNCQPLHLWHPTNFDQTNLKFNENLFEQRKQSGIIVDNIDKRWGEGGA